MSFCLVRPRYIQFVQHSDLSSPPGFRKENQSQHVVGILIKVNSLVINQDQSCAVGIKDLRRSELFGNQEGVFVNFKINWLHYFFFFDRSPEKQTAPI